MNKDLLALIQDANGAMQSNGHEPLNRVAYRIRGFPYIGLNKFEYYLLRSLDKSVKQTLEWINLPQAGH